MSKAIIFLADGFEECEGLLVADILRRAKAEVITASINSSKSVISSHNITVQADALAEDIDYSAADLIVLPGGLAGTANLAASDLVAEQCRAFASGKKLAAICAAPSILASLGLLSGKRATVHPSFESKMGDAVLTHEAVTVDGNIITGRGLGAAIPFALELAKQLCGKETADRIAASICYQ